MVDTSGIDTVEARRLSDKEERSKQRADRAQQPPKNQEKPNQKNKPTTSVQPQNAIDEKKEGAAPKFSATEDFCEQDTSRADNTHAEYSQKCAQCLYRVYNKDKDSIAIKRQAQGYEGKVPGQGMFFTQCYAPSYTFNVACRCYSYSMEDCWCEAFPAGVGFLAYVLVPLILMVYYCCIFSCLRNKFCPLSICVAKYRRWAIENGIDLDEASVDDEEGSYDAFDSQEYDEEEESES